jgi:hypothetical protein
MIRLSLPLLLCVAAALAGCEFATNAVGPSVSGGVGGAQPVAIVPLDTAKLGQPAGAQVAQFHGNLAQLQQAAVQQLQRARQLQADMDAGVAGYQIAAGTIQPGQQAAANPAAWQNAQAQLRGVSVTLDQMSGLSNDVAKNVAYGAFLLQSIREASAAPSAGGEDRRQLGVLDEAAQQTSTSLDQLLEALRREVLTKSHFLGMEGAKLAQIAPPSAAVAMAPQQPDPYQQTYQPTAAGQPGAGLASGRPFVVIRFANPGVEYEQQLYEAVSAALSRSPDVAFDLVAVAPPGGTPEESVWNAENARASTEKVMRSLVDMGLPPDRVSYSQVTDPNVQGNEVQLYVR